MKLLLLVLTCLSIAAADSHKRITAAGCGETKHCYQFPEGCEPNTPECRFISWRPSGKGDSKYVFEMSGDSGKGDRYISFGLALISDMKDGDMYYCDGENFGVGSIDVRRETPTYLPIGEGVTDVTAETVDGVGQCTFTRSALINRVISEGADHDFDIENHKYYLLVAVGNMKNNLLTLHDWRVHIRESYDYSKEPGKKALTAKAKYWFILSLAKAIAMMDESDD